MFNVFEHLFLFIVSHNFSVSHFVVKSQIFCLKFIIFGQKHHGLVLCFEMRDNILCVLNFQNFLLTSYISKFFFHKIVSNFFGGQIAHVPCEFHAFWLEI